MRGRFRCADDDCGSCGSCLRRVETRRTKRAAAVQAYMHRRDELAVEISRKTEQLRELDDKIAWMQKEKET